MKGSRKTIEQLNQKLDKAQIIERLKQINLKGGTNGGGGSHGNCCPPPSI